MTMTDFQRLNERYLAENEHRQELIRAERMHRELLDEQRKQTSAIERQNQSHGGGWLIIGLFAILVASRTCRRVFIILSALIIIAGLLVMIAIPNGSGTAIAMSGAVGLAIGAVTSVAAVFLHWLTRDVKEEWS